MNKKRFTTEQIIGNKIGEVSQIDEELTKSDCTFGRFIDSEHSDEVGGVIGSIRCGEH